MAAKPGHVNRRYPIPPPTKRQLWLLLAAIALGVTWLSCLVWLAVQTLGS